MKGMSRRGDYWLAASRGGSRIALIYALPVDD
jgi:hypothetical protein